MIFKTIDDNDSLSGQRIVSKFTARKIAQEEAAKQLEIDIQCLRNYEAECQKGSVSTETFSNTMKGASIEAQRYATNIKEGTGSASTFASNQRAIQASMSETSIVSKAATVGLNLFKAALNSLIFFAVIEGIQLLIKGIDNLILTAEEAEEKAETLRSNMQSFFDEVQSGQQTISSVSDRFSELSEHVTKTGENIDLTKDEYSEYLDICNQVKDIMPELVTGYTNKGNAIITLKDKDNVDSLTESYKKNIKAKAASFITNGDDDGNTIQSFFDDYDIFTNGENGLFAPSAGGLWNNKSTDYEDYYGYDKVHEWLSDVSEMSLKDLQNLQKDTTEATYLYALLKENGYELANITEDDYNAVHDVLTTRLTSLESEMTTRVGNIKMSLQQMLYADGDYWNIDDKEALSALDSFFASIDDEFIKQNNLLSQTALQSFESNAVDLFQNSSTKQSMIDIFTPQGEDESIKDYTTRVENAISEIQKYCDENGITIPFNFGTEDNPKGVQKTVNDLQKSYDNAISSAKEKYSEDLTPFFEENSINTQEEIDKWNEVAASCDTATEAKKKYLGTDSPEETPISFKQAWKNLDSTDDDKLKNLKKDLTTLAESGKLTEKSFNKTPGAKTWLEQLGIDAETAVNKINELTDNSKPLSSLKANVKLVQDAFADKRDNGVAGSDTINAMEPEFGKLKFWKKYKETLGSTTSTLNKCREAQNKLVSEYVNNNNFLVKLVKSTGEVDDATKAYYTSQLKELGIKNAKDVVDQQILNRQNEIHQKKSEEIIDIKTASTSLADATQDEIDSLVKEVEQLDGNTNALKLYLLQKMMSKDDALDTEDSVKNLISLAEECDASKAVVDNLKNALKNLQENGNVKLGVGIDVSVNNPISGTILDGSFIKNGFPTLKESFINQQNNKEQQNYIDTAKSENEKRLRKQNKKLQTKINTLLKDAASSNSKSNGSSSSKSNTSKEFNWIDVLIKRTERKVQKSIDRITDYASKKTKNNLFGKALKAYGKEEKTYANVSDFYLKKFNKVKISKNAKKDAEWKRKIKNGKLDIQTVANEKLADKISKAQDYYDNYLDYQDKQTGAKQNALALRKQKLDDDIAYIEAKSDRIQRLSDSVQNRIDNNDALGLATSENSYKELIKYSKKQVKRWIDEKATYAEYLSTLKRGSTEYIETEQKIADCDNKIQDAQKSQLEWNQTIAQMPLTALENFSNILSSIISGFGQLNSLLESQNKKLTDNDIKTAIESRNSLISSNQSEIEEYKGTQLTNAFRAIINAKYNGVYGAKIVNKEADPIAAKARSYIDQILAGTMSLDSFYAEMSKSTGMTIDYLKQSEGLTTILNSITNLNSDNYSLMQEQEEYTDKLIDNEIQNYQDLIDEMNKANDAKQKAIELTEKEIALQKALENRTNLIYRNGKYVYESDSSAVKEAKNNLDDYFAQRAIDKLQEVVDKLEDLKKELNYRDGTGLLFARVDGLINYAKQRISKITGIPHYAKGTTSAKGGLSLTGEKGTELRVLNRGDGIIPADITKNLMEFGVDPAKMITDNLNKNIPDYKNIITPVNASTDNSIHIDKVEMSGVNDVQSFMKELSHLTLDAQQRAYKR